MNPSRSKKVEHAAFAVNTYWPRERLTPIFCTEDRVFVLGPLIVRLGRSGRVRGRRSRSAPLQRGALTYRRCLKGAMMFIRRSAAAPVLVLALILSACGASAAPPTAAPAAPTAAPAAVPTSAAPAVA